MLKFYIFCLMRKKCVAWYLTFPILGDKFTIMLAKHYILKKAGLA